MPLRTINTFDAAGAYSLTDLVAMWQTGTVKGNLADLIAYFQSKGSFAVNAQVGTSYALVAADRAKYVSFSNAAAIAVTIAQAGTTGFEAGWYTLVKNLGVGTVTITPATSTVDGAATLVLTTGQWAILISDGTNYSTFRGSSSSSSGTAGKHAIYIAAAAMIPSATGGCAPLATIASAANQPDITTINFDATTQEYAQFGFEAPKSWNEGTVTFVPIWSHAATATNFGVVWDLQLVAVSDDDTIAAAFGTAQISTDTGGTTNDIYRGPESSAITVGGSPAAQDMLFGRISRVTGNGSDTMAIDARLHGVVVFMTTDAETDA